MNSRSGFYGTKSKLRLVFTIIKHCTCIWIYNAVFCYQISEIEVKKKQKYLVRTTRFWNNVHQVRSKQKYLKPNNLKIFGSKKTKGSSKQDRQKIIVHLHFQTLLHKTFYMPKAVLCTYRFLKLYNVLWKTLVSTLLQISLYAVLC